MDLYEVFLKWGIPRDIIGIIDEYVSRGRYPCGITRKNELKAKREAIDIRGPFTDNIILIHNDNSDDHEWLNIETYESGPLDSDNYVEVISAEEYLFYHNRLHIKNARSGIVKAFDFEGILWDFLYMTKKNGVEIEVTATATNELFYLPTAGVFAVRYESKHPEHRIPDNMLATGTSLIKRFVPIEPDAIKFTMDDSCRISNLYNDFAIIHNNTGTHIIFREGVKYRVDNAIKFTTDSALFTTGRRIYFRRVGCPLVEIQWLEGIRLSSIRVYGNRIAYQPEYFSCIYFGDIKWTY